MKFRMDQPPRVATFLAIRLGLKESKSGAREVVPFCVRPRSLIPDHHPALRLSPRGNCGRLRSSDRALPATAWDVTRIAGRLMHRPSRGSGNTPVGKTHTRDADDDRA